MKRNSIAALARTGAALGALLGALSLAPASAGEIKVLSGNGSRPAIIELAARFERETGNKVVIEFAVNPTVRKKIESGEAFDVAVLNPPVLDALIKQGRILADSRAVIGRIGLGMAGRAGLPKPDISTVDAFKRVLLSANYVAYPGDGASGIYFAGLVDRLGIAEQMKSKMRPMPGEYNVEVVASGEPGYVVVVASRIFGVPGAELIGMIPDELQTWIGFTTGVGAAAKDPATARAFTRFLTAPAAGPLLTTIGMEPFKE